LFCKLGFLDYHFGKLAKPQFLALKTHYPDFERDPHPALFRCVRLNLRTRQIECNEYGQRTNPPVLHRKETFLARDDARREKFARLTAQEEKHGLLADTSGIGRRDGWRHRLAERGFSLKGHRLMRLNGKPENQDEDEDR
jgi:DNA phosphorothioation-associated putative methyltransferase